MGKSKKPFIDKKNSSTYHLLYRSQRDVADNDNDDNDNGNGAGGKAGVVLWPSPNNNQETDQKVLLGRKNTSAGEEGEDATLQTWKQELSKLGVVDEYNYDKHMKPITGTGVFFQNKETNSKKAAAMANARGQDLTIQDELVKEVDRQLDSIALTADCMDDDIAQALFGDFDEGDYEELNDEFVFDASQVGQDDDQGNGGFDFAAHINGLMEKARMESDETREMSTIHEQGMQDRDFFAGAQPLGEDDDEDEFANLDGRDVFNIDGTPGVVPKLSEAEEKALCDKFEQALLEYDSDEIGEGVDDDDVVGPLPLEGDKQVEAALDDFLLEKQDEIFMEGARHYLEGENGSGITKGGSGFAALVGKKMIPLKNLDESADVQDIRPIEDVLGEADYVLGAGRPAPPAEEIFIDGKSYYSEKMRNPWDCESILSTYSNLDNNPMTIGAGGRRRKTKNKKGSGGSIAPIEEAHEQILLSEKTGLPLGVLPSRDDDGGDGFDTYVSVNKGEARNKEENNEDKKLRKLQVKKERQMARMQKKMMKEAFADEFTKRQQEVMVDDVGGKTVFRF